MVDANVDCGPSANHNPGEGSKSMARQSITAHDSVQELNFDRSTATHHIV